MTNEDEDVIDGALPSTAKDENDKSAVDLRTWMENCVVGEGGKLARFEVSKGRAYVTIQGDSARTAVVTALRKGDGVKVTPSSSLGRQLMRNKKRQEKSDAAKKRFADAKAAMTSAA